MNDDPMIREVAGYFGQHGALGAAPVILANVRRQWLGADVPSLRRAAARADLSVAVRKELLAEIDNPTAPGRPA
jgi:hypothetical protein